jgi:hypothetical protein
VAAADPSAAAAQRNRFLSTGSFGPLNAIVRFGRQPPQTPQQPQGQQPSGAAAAAAAATLTPAASNSGPLAPGVAAGGGAAAGAEPRGGSVSRQSSTASFASLGSQRSAATAGAGSAVDGSGGRASTRPVIMHARRPSDDLRQARVPSVATAPVSLSALARPVEILPPAATSTAPAAAAAATAAAAASGTGGGAASAPQSPSSASRPGSGVLLPPPPAMPTTPPRGSPLVAARAGR